MNANAIASRLPDTCHSMTNKLKKQIKKCIPMIGEALVWHILDDIVKNIKTSFDAITLIWLG